jgi:mgtE-like transporter
VAVSGLWSRLRARALRVLGPDVAGARQGLVALLVTSAADLIAGLTLGSIQGTLAELPGLLVLVPAAIGMRGNIFGALGSRLGTAIHTGTFGLSRRPDTLVGQNILASMALTLSVSMALAVLAKAVSVAFGLESMSAFDFLVISLVGGILSSAVVLVLTLAVAARSVRSEWDMDNVAAPIVTAAGDLVTLPALFLATYLVGIRVVTFVVGVLLAVASLVALVAALRAGLPILRRIVAESLPVLVVAGIIDVVAGVTIEKRLDTFLALPALLVLVPLFLQDIGALGGILAARLSSKLHLGLIEPVARPQRPARDDFLLVLVLAVPVFVLVALSVDLVALVFGLASPGPLRMLGISLLGGLLAMGACLVVTYYGAIAAYRFGLDPDSHGIPLVTSSMDLLGTVSLVFAIVLVGLA